jgi:hypothetical protein
MEVDVMGSVNWISWGMETGLDVTKSGNWILLGV